MSCQWNVLLVALALAATCTVCEAMYRVGVGRADCTGPPVEITFMGFAQINQKGHGIHLRQYARSFIFEKDGVRTVFVSVDAGMTGHAVKREVIQKLQKMYGDIYSFDNVIISGTHTHGAPGGFLMYLLYDLTILGFVAETFRAQVDGITSSIVRAHGNMRNARLFISEIEVHDANINRSPSAYENNPDEEKAQYEHNVDKTLVQLRMVDERGDLMGAINWFAVHPTSMNNTNRLVTSDNLGLASILLEQEINNNHMAGYGSFVGAFASTNLGDVSPNIMGPKCERTGLPCDVLTSSCPEGAGMCFASGPGRDMFDSTKIIATRIYEGASQLVHLNGGREVTGIIKFAHTFAQMVGYTTTYFNPQTKMTENVTGCIPAMGYSFAAGTIDGPGAFDFKQGTTSENPLWNLVRDFLAAPTGDDIFCHRPKPILLATGRATFPYEWQPPILPFQLVLIGDVALAAVPGELTTMSGRRLRNAIARTALQAGGTDVQVIVAGLSNMYSSYVATPEEYAIQRYEGASTIFGPHTLAIYLTEFEKLMTALTNNESVDPGPWPAFIDDKQISLNAGVIYDGHPIGSGFGYVRAQPLNVYERGDQVYARFVAANPRNHLMRDQHTYNNYFAVEQKQVSGNWTVVATDADWETRFVWQRTSTILGHSEIEFFWDIPEHVERGSYRIRHFGAFRFILGGVWPYQGSTRVFIVE